MSVPGMPHITIPRVPIAPPFKFPQFGSQIEGFVPRRRKKPFKRGKRRYAYTPSIGASLLGITMPKAPKGMLTGIGIRPLIVPSSRRRSYRASRRMFKLPKGFR